MNKKFKITIYIASLFFLLVFLALIFRNPLSESGKVSALSLFRSSLLKNEIVIQLLHSYHSLRKLPDIFFLPYYFTESKLPEYNLHISQEDIAMLNEYLPHDPISGFLYDENRIWVKGIFSFGDYSSEVDVRYRGTNANHWNSMKKSLKIKFPPDNLFEGMKSINLITPYDREYFIEPLNFYRAKKLGLTTLDLYFTRLKFNGQDLGVYLTYEHWTDDWFKKRRIAEDTVVYGGDNIVIPAEDTDSVSDAEESEFSPYFIPVKGGRAHWNKYGDAEYEGSFETFANIISYADDETFRKNIGNILDLEKFYAWNIVNVLIGSSHHGYTGNTFLLYNPIAGRFEFSPWDVKSSQANDADGVYIDNEFMLSARIFRFDEFRERRNDLLESYFQDDKQLEDDLAFYDNLHDRTKADFYKDSAKLYNNFQFRSQVGWFRDIVINNFQRAESVLEYDSDYYCEENDQALWPSDFELTASYDRFFEAGYSIEEFLEKNPKFFRQGDNTVLLPHGTYTFYEDVIIPSGLQLMISPGTTLYLDEGVSIVVYGKVTAQGEEHEPIKILPIDPSRPWGTFAIVNAEDDKSFLYEAEFNGGSGDIINGITFTGMVAFHNSDATIVLSKFRNAGDDDALNVKYGLLELGDSVFEGNLSDGVDVDFAKEESAILNNKFYNNGHGGGGDAIDLSWSDIKIENNEIDGSTDKGISIGEKSNPYVIDNVIQNCDIGIAVKDLSVADLVSNDISNCRVGISAYQKKDVFGGGVARVRANTFDNIEKEYEQDEKSNIYEISE